MAKNSTLKFCNPVLNFNTDSTCSAFINFLNFTNVIILEELCHEINCNTIFSIPKLV